MTKSSQVGFSDLGFSKLQCLALFKDPGRTVSPPFCSLHKDTQCGNRAVAQTNWVPKEVQGECKSMQE